MMKRFAGVVLLLLLAAVAIGAAPGDAPQPQGMSLRLELFVTDMEKSKSFYAKVLGFEAQKGSASYQPMKAGSVLIGLGLSKNLPKQHYFNPELQSERRGLGAEIVLEVADVQATLAAVKAAGHPILSELRKQPWGATDFRIADPDGYYLRITSR